MSVPFPQTMFSQIDVTSAISPQPIEEDPQTLREMRQHQEVLSALRDIANLQKRQNDLLTQLICIQTAAQRQKAADLQNWRNAHPELTQGCRDLLKKMVEMQTDYFTRMVEHSIENDDCWEGSEFMFNEFVDQFGPRLIHLNCLLQSLSQLAGPSQNETAQKC